MRQTNLGRHQGIAVLTALSILLAFGGAAQAAPDEDEPKPPAEPETPPPPKAELQPASPVTASEAPATLAPHFESMGPETFPGRMRGLYGGSLWLEPSFHGLQWPQNARTGIGVSGMFWVDSGYEKINRDSGNEMSKHTPALTQLPNSSMFVGQGRGVLRVTPAYVRDGFFIQGQAELVGNLCQTASAVNTACDTGNFNTDDLWIRFGQWNRWDVKAGRFEGWEVYHLGMGLDPNTLERKGPGMFGADNPTTPPLEVPSFYGVNYMHDRPADGLAEYAALHAYPLEYLRFELLAKLGTNNYRKQYLAENLTNETSFSYFGGRPTLILDIGWLKFKIGAEYQKRTAVMQTIDAGQKKDAVEELDQKGAGASLQFVIDPVIEFGLNAAIGKQSYTNATGNGIATAEDWGKSFTTKSLGGFANARLADGWLVGVGANWTTQLDGYLAPGSGANDYTTNLQGFLALQYLLARQLYIKAVVAYARAKFQPSDLSVPTWNNDMYSGRIRLMYLY
jgi:hypothetical protein